MRRVATLLTATVTVVVLSACGTSAPTASPSAAAITSPSEAPSLVLRDVVATPVQRTTAGIAIAFDAAQAADLVDEVPADLDFATTALLCVYLGARPSGTWTLTLQSAALVAGELRIAAREKQSGGPAAVTYPADCATVNRNALPTGELPVRADDTNSGEFITDGTLHVANVASAP